MANARAWALRCTLELEQHRSATFTTLTYNDQRLPPTLEKTHLALFLKRLRKRMGPTRPIRFFACGEYGEQNGRPHYHALLYGASTKDADTIEETWGQGFTSTYDVTPAAISYVAGYSAKKIGYAKEAQTQRVDPETGEVYRWQPPFLQMSRRPGIGGEARQFTQSWRLYAVHNGTRIPVPRYLHEAWKESATEQQIEELIDEKSKLALHRDTTPERLAAAEQIAIRKQKERSERRKL